MQRVKLSIPLYFILGGIVLLMANCSNNNNGGSQQEVSVFGPYIDSLTQRIEKEPEKAILYAQRGEAFYESNNFDAAIKDLNKALELDKDMPDFYRVLSNVYFDYYKSKEAIDILRTAVERFPTNIPLILKLSEFQMLTKQHGASIQSATSILEFDNLNSEAYFMLGVNYKFIGDTTKAINSFQTAVEQDPDLLEGFLELGLLFDRQGKGELALQYFNNALDIDPFDIPALYAKGMYYTDRMMDNQAIETFKKINSIDREYADPYVNVGLIYLEHDSIQQAYNNFNIAAEVEPTMAKAFYYRALTGEMLGKINAAIEDYKNARNLDRDEVYLARIEQKLVELQNR